jgi:hypothetical protein
VSGTSFAAFNNGSPLYAPGGSWSAPTGSGQASPMFVDGQWRVLLRQFSIIGPLTNSLYVQMNLSGADSGGAWSAGGSWTFNSAPAPGALGLLCIAGLGNARGTRRRLGR